MRSISANGVLPQDIGVIYRTESGYEANISNIRFTNIDNTPYVVELYKVTSKGSKILLYKINVNANNIVNDDTPYKLANGTYLMAKSDKPNTNYAINGEELASDQKPPQ
jgi:hypothetical protein